jgi:hypothetical protein
LGNVAGGLGAWEAAVAVVAALLTLVELVAWAAVEVTAAARVTVLDGRGRADIVGAAVLGFGDKAVFAGSFASPFAGSFFAIVDDGGTAD